MKKIILVVLFIGFNLCYSQSNIDLKTLILQPKDTVIKKLNDWDIKAEPAFDNPDYYYAFGTGFQMEIGNGKVNTIWVYFENGSEGEYPFQVDEYIGPGFSFSKAIEVYGTPNKTGGGFSMEKTGTNGWIKWEMEKLQLHCTITQGRITMVTLMEPNWFPGK